MNALESFFNLLSDRKIDILLLTVEHIYLTFIALFIAIIIAVPLGILLSRFKKLSPAILNIFGIIQTIPSIALLGLLIPLLGIGMIPGIVALFLYSVFPILRNTYSAIDEVNPAVIEAAKGIGLPKNQVLIKIELSLAVPVIFAGIRTASALCIGIATLAALVGAGGLGDFIFGGIALNNTNLILAGALPATLLAVFFDTLFALLQKHIRRIIKYVLMAAILLAIALMVYILLLQFTEFGPERVGEYSANGDEAQQAFTFTDYYQFITSRILDIGTFLGEHIYLSLMALFIAMVLGIPIGIIIALKQKISGVSLNIFGMIQTIPAVALLGFMIPLLGVGPIPAIIALFLYSIYPIIRNTYIGITEINPNIIEAARGIGLPEKQVLTKIKLSLAAPVIFAGIRTSSAICIGIATLCALIASGGLGEFIFRGLALNDSRMLIAGAVPAALLALFFDFMFSQIQKYIRKIIKPLLIVLAVFITGFSTYGFINEYIIDNFLAGFTPEFMERSDGYPGFKEHYGFEFETVQINNALMYKALKEGAVDIISGYATDGRIEAYDLKVLEDDKTFFPPYYAAPVIRGEVLDEYPEIKDILYKLEGKIDDPTMRRLNFRVDDKNIRPKQVALEFLNQLGYSTDRDNTGEVDIIIGTKSFTEQYILGWMMTILIENYSDLTVEIRPGLAGTKICFSAMKNGEIDIYPEYSGTALLVILKTDMKTVQDMLMERQALYDYVKQHLDERFNFHMLGEFGFDNTYALLMRSDHAQQIQVDTITELKHYLVEEDE